MAGLYRFNSTRVLKTIVLEYHSFLHFQFMALTNNVKNCRLTSTYLIPNIETMDETNAKFSPVP